MKARSVVLLILLLLVVLAVGLVVVMALAFGGFGKGKVPETTLLEADLETAVIEYVPRNPFAQIVLEDAVTTRDLVEALERAAGDERVAGFVALVGAAPMGLAQVQEIRDAVSAFREAGKPAIAYAETFGEVGPGNSAYYLATAFDEIYLLPSGDVNLTGLIATSPFLRGTLEKLDVEPRMDHRYEYKNAMNLFTEEAFTEAHEEATQALMESWFAEMTEGIAAGRDIPAEELPALVDRGPFLGQEAVDAGLVDGLAYRDEVYDKAREKAGEGSELLYLSSYLKRAGRPHDDGEAIALIYGVGGVVRGGEEYDPFSGSFYLASDAVAKAFRDAVDDEDVRAILFRVDSPGGSYVASDAVWRETVRAEEAGKPVVVSMGNLAASGGYFVSMSAEKIVAQPATITGSIGVLGGKLLDRGLWNKLGITFDSVQTNPRADFYSSLHDYTEAGWERHQAWLDRVYEDFTSKVAEGRGLELERVREIAKGRVWTGADAKERGLVDALGGYATALELAREAAGIDPEADVELRVFPRPKSTWDLLFGKGASSSEGRAAVALAARMLRELQPAVRAMRRLGLIEEGPRPLAVPPGVVPEGVR